MEELETLARSNWANLDNFIQSLVIPWRFYQVVIILVLFVVAHLLTLWLRPRIDAWMRGLEGLRTSQLRVLILLARRTRGIVLMLLAWTTSHIAKAWAPFRFFASF